MDKTPPIPLARAWVGVAILILAYIASFIDRGIFALLIEPIKADLDLSDTQISWLMGPAFGIMYAALGLPVAWLADRYSRRTIIAIGMTFWSIMTAMCGLSRDSLQLALARIGVGVGEATLGPSAYSLISDSFTRDKALRAVGLFTMGQSIGAGLAFLVGGQVIAWVGSAAAINLPIVGILEPWQVTFVVVGLPSLLLVPLLYVVAEPPRAGKAANPGEKYALFRFVRQERALIAPLFIGASITTVLGYAYFWVPEMFRRVWEWDMQLIGITYGGGLAIAGPLGVVIGSRLSERLFAAGDPAGPLRAIIISVGLFAIFGAAAPLMPSAELSMAAFIPALIALAMSSATTSAAVLHIAPAAIRAQFSAAYLLTITLMGVIFGPTSVAMLTDSVFRDETMLNWSLATVALTMSLLSLMLLAIARKAYRRVSSAGDASAPFRMEVIDG
ncbi:MAG: MFS transporter [Parasphingopyxis sp.]|uniref:MFS transporter n=1 Tax=Parasphingopyxis sp. TaxID=1920299 RepID=UPI003F9F3350